ncbi:MAG: dihydroorotate dehydrogenase electron transfer subunit [Thermoanaerobacteraceae bacterium]|nr:dihydroorotate dehydrogenase electron transfer subunit [Thermoanaerobacteraceae bacterium]
MQRQYVEIKNLKQLTGRYYLLTLAAPLVARSVKPGQFVQLKVSAQLDPLLRRPFSIHDWCDAQGNVEILFQVRGKGTRLLADRKQGDYLDMLGPLGNGFSIPRAPGKALLIGGGIGAAPLWGLAKSLHARNWQVTVLLGGAGEQFLVRPEEFSRWGRTIITTDDGSRGISGRVTEALPLVAAQEFDQIYACGPKPMLAAIYDWARITGLPLQVSLDEVMACGMGVCLGCAHPVRKGKETVYAKVCSQGPVFDAREVVWHDQA